MNKSRILAFIISIILVLVSIAVASKGDTVPTSNIISTTDEALQDMKGVWVSYITLDMQNTDMSEDSFVMKIKSIVEMSKDNGFNTIIFQVRPFCDALYKSQYFPYSHILTGEQGKKTKYDPLEIMCKVCHDNNVKIHAWINPYRVKTESTPSTLSEDNPYKIDESIGFTLNDSIYLDPSNKQAQRLIINGVKEIVRNYDVDGIQFDDYFYPENCDEIDESTYNKYKESSENPLSKEKWRIENVNNLIKAVYKTVHKNSHNVVFGISPQGNLNNNYSISADVKSWCKEKGYIDYICPQIYFSLDNPTLSFEESLNEWLKINKHNNLSVYIGIAGYKGGTEEDEGTWLDNNDILKTQIEICEEKNLDGIMLYSYESFFDKVNEEEISNVVQHLTNIKED